MADRNLLILDKNIDLIHSPDEGIWYFQWYGEPRDLDDISISYKSREKALEVYRNGKKIEWQPKREAKCQK